MPADNLCTDQSLSVVLYTDKATYKVGDQPVFTIAVTNGGLTECVRDIGKSAQNVVVRSLDGTRTLWSARDCSPAADGEERDFRTRSAGRDTITWSGTTSTPGCKTRASRFRQVPTARSARSASGNPHRSPSTSSHQRSSRNRDQQPVAVARRFRRPPTRNRLEPVEARLREPREALANVARPDVADALDAPADRQRWSPAAPAAIEACDEPLDVSELQPRIRANSR